MTITKKDLDTRYAHWFRNVSQPEQAKAEILKQFSEEPEPYEWTEQDIWEQSRKDPYKVEPCLMLCHPGSDSPGGLLFFERLLPSGIVFFKQKTAYEIMPSLVGSEMCIRDSLSGLLPNILLGPFVRLRFFAELL